MKEERKKYNKDMADDFYAKFKRNFSLDTVTLFENITNDLNINEQQQIIDRAQALCLNEGNDPSQHFKYCEAELELEIGDLVLTRQFKKYLLTKQGCQFTFMAIYE